MMSLPKLMKSLVGRRAEVEGRQLLVVEWLEASQSLALQETGSTREDFQDNQYGNAGRRVRRTWTLSCVNESKNAPHPVIRQFMNPREIQLANQLLGQP